MVLAAFTKATDASLGALAVDPEVPELGAVGEVGRQRRHEPALDRGAGVHACGVYACVRVRVHVRACVRACVRVVCVCVCARSYVPAVSE